jgi:antitoxin PrlF
MSAKSRITSKGQVTVPVEIRRKLGLRPGDHVEFEQRGEHTVIRRAGDIGNPFDRYKGVLKGLGGNARAIRRWTAALRDDRE